MRGGVVNEGFYCMRFFVRVHPIVPRPTGEQLTSCCGRPTSQTTHSEEWAEPTQVALRECVLNGTLLGVLADGKISDMVETFHISMTMQAGHMEGVQAMTIT